MTISGRREWRKKRALIRRSNICGRTAGGTEEGKQARLEYSFVRSKSPPYIQAYTRCPMISYNEIIR